MKKLTTPVPLAFALCLLASGAQARAEQACIPPGIGNLPPVYPATEAKSRIGGTAMLAATFDRCGKPTEVAIKVSSGSPGLDFSARRTVRSWTLPQLAGKTVDIPIAFVPEPYELTDAERAKPQLPVGGIERDACDLSWWVVADESSATGPFVVRDRMLYAPAIAEARTRYLCEGTPEQCEGLLEMLRNREDQPPAPPPLPPAPPGMCP